ncbi:F-box/WD repeat-containing protein 7-like [Lytechinus variegatus]|uniref:F-box/WD repeat-containing protein 7-like n=1 Tax=Lytechinus variegatus TaxID=7654 RepID=UPI001BB18D89|nr:F-box/WD repeat-containing protein 7-like [Lytechinus variegatus]XP_041453442.1 F-box/WD repeat-containing protein 7-like [Lytechinus variegatus]XP_041453448.1 F-box/WD repeat-containing protein 7-like [Lytechinus variegatus]
MAKVDINSADVDALTSLLGVGRNRAEAIVQHREASGGFNSIQDLITVPGIGSNVVDINRNRLQCRTNHDDRTQSTPSSNLRNSSLSSSSSSSSPSVFTPSQSNSSSHASNSSGLVRRGRYAQVRTLYSSSSASQTHHSSSTSGSSSSTFGFRRRTTRLGSILEPKTESDCNGNNDTCPSPPAPAIAKVLRSGPIAVGGDGDHPESKVAKRKSEPPLNEEASTSKKTCKPPKFKGGSIVPYPMSTALRSHGSSSSGSPQRKRLTSFLQQSTPPSNLATWLKMFQGWNQSEKKRALDDLIERCEPSQVRHIMSIIEPQFQRDFISLLPRELALYVLSFLEPRDLLRAAQTCHYWRILCEDNLLWKEKCRETGIEELNGKQTKRRSNSGVPRSPWKSMYLRQHQIQYNWRFGEIKTGKALKGHDDHVITCLQFNGQRIVSGSDDNTLKVWSALTGKCLRTLVGHTGGVWSSQMNNNIVISGSTDRTLKVWNADTGHCIHTLYGHTSTVRCMHLHGNKVVSGSRDATLRLWDIETGQCLHVLMGHVAAVRCVQYDGRRVVSGAYDYTVKVWNPETEECLHTLQGHTNRVYSLQFDGTHIVSGSLDTSIRVWDADTGECKHTLTGHQSLTSGMELKDNILVSGNADSTVKIWDITSGQCLQTLQGANKHQSAVTCLQFNRKFVITCSDDGTVKLWDLNTGEFIRNLVTLDSGGSGGVVWRVCANPTKLVCAVGSRNGTEETKLLVLDFEPDPRL